VALISCSLPAPVPALSYSGMMDLSELGLYSNRLLVLSFHEILNAQVQLIRCICKTPY
jgi:hypothetical protein